MSEQILLDIIQGLYDATNVVYDPDDEDNKNFIREAYNAELDGLVGRVVTALSPPPPPKQRVPLRFPANVPYPLVSVAIAKLRVDRVRWRQPPSQTPKRYLYVSCEQLKMGQRLLEVHAHENDLAVDGGWVDAASATDTVTVEVVDFDGAPVDAEVVVTVQVDAV